METAILDAIARDTRRRGHALRLVDILGGVRREAVDLNATVAERDTEKAATAAAIAVEAGFRCVKLKVGLAAGPRDEAERVAAVRRALGPDVSLRLDANGAWDVAEAIAVIKACEQYGIELVEQPVAAADLAGMAEVRRSVGVHIAADESATTVSSARAVIEAKAADVLVIKPTVAGGLGPSAQIAQLARDAGLEVVVTSAFESGIGVAAALHLAASLPDPLLACGLATVSLLASDLLRTPLTVAAGRMALPAGPGLGVELDLEQLAVWTIQ